MAFILYEQMPNNIYYNSTPSLATVLQIQLASNRRALGVDLVFIKSKALLYFVFKDFSEDQTKDF